MIGFFIQSSFAVFTLYMESVRREKRESEKGGKRGKVKVSNANVTNDVANVTSMSRSQHMTIFQLFY
jgi:hypothetical protein